jgi:signal recognition particle subunit SRP54
VGREESLKFQQKMLRDTLSLDDFLSQIRKVKKMGSFKDLIALIPGFSQLKDLDAGDEQFAMAEAIISSMTREERRNPAIIGASRRRRIAAGAGVAVNEVSRILKQFEEVTKQLSSFARAGQLMDRMLPGTGAKPRLLSEEERRELRRRRKLERQRRREGRK